jgi:hypothetical protein
MKITAYESLNSFPSDKSNSPAVGTMWINVWKNYLPIEPTDVPFLTAQELCFQEERVVSFSIPKRIYRSASIFKLLL